MRGITLLALLACLAPESLYAQLPPLEVRAIRLNAAEPAKLAEFYTAVFGFKKIEAGTGPSVLMVGGTRLTFARKPATAGEDPVAHLILNVAQLNPLIEKAKANGAVLTREPSESVLHNMVAYIRDPGGNVVELVAPMPGASKIF